MPIYTRKDDISMAKKKKNKEINEKSFIVKLDRGDLELTKSGLPFVDNWKPKPEDEYVKYSGDCTYIEFDKLFGLEDKRLNNFDLTKKRAYITKEDTKGKVNESFNSRTGIHADIKSTHSKERVIVLICRYTNYLIKFYDEGNKILLAIMYMKYLIHEYPGMSEDDFKKYLRQIVLTDEVIDMIKRMTEDNYQFDLNAESAKKEKHNNTQYHKKIKITDKHAKLMYSISTAIKLTAPLMTQYLKVNNDVEVDPFLTSVEVGMFKYFEVDTNLYMKLMIYSESKLNTLKPQNRTSINKREKEEGKSIDTDFTETILQRLIHGNFIKFVFNGHVVTFIHSILKNQAETVLTKEKPKRDTFIVENSADSGGEDEPMTATDKIEIHMSKVDEGNIIKSNMNIKMVIDRLIKKFNVRIPDDEYKYYEDRLKFSNIQRELMNMFYAKYFKDSTEIVNVSKKQYITLAIMLKKYLISIGYDILPYCILSNLEERPGRAMKINKAMLTELQKDREWEDLLFKYRGVLSEQDILDKMGEVINKNYKAIDFKYQEFIPDPIDFEPVNLLKELRQYMLDV